MRVFNAWWAPPAEEQRKNSESAMLELKKFFDEAYAYSKMSSVAEKNLKFEAMRDIFSGKKKLIIAVGSAKEITSAVNFSKSYGITPVLAGGNDAITTLDFIKEQGVSMILEQPHALPDRDDEDVDLPFKRASILKAKGIPFCLSIDGSWQQRNLPFMAGTAAAYGLTKEEALKAVSLDAAEVLGVSKTLGSLEIGKDATLLISDGDLLDMRTSNVTRAFIKGAEIDLDNKQKELYRLYSEKYNLK
jgi:imidazolonepropionase-like amidohydrolase